MICDTLYQKTSPLQFQNKNYGDYQKKNKNNTIITKY